MVLAHSVGMCGLVFYGGFIAFLCAIGLAPFAVAALWVACAACGRGPEAPTTRRADRPDHLCPLCGKPVPSGVRFCVSCGYHAFDAQKERADVELGLGASGARQFNIGLLVVIAFAMVFCHILGVFIAGALLSDVLGRGAAVLPVVWFLAPLPATWLLGSVLLQPVLHTAFRHAASVSILAITLFGVPAGLIYWLIRLFLK